MKTKILSFIIALFLAPCLFAQSNSGFSFQIQMIPNELEINNYDTIYNVSCILSLQDTVNISKIHVKMGTSNGAADKLNYAFLFDINGGFPGNQSYYRNANTVTLGWGQFSAGIYFYEVWLEYTSGALSQPQLWNSWTQ